MSSTYLLFYSYITSISMISSDDYQGQQPVIDFISLEAYRYYMLSLFLDDID